jgi:hypothetical protein
MKVRTVSMSCSRSQQPLPCLLLMLNPSGVVAIGGCHLCLLLFALPQHRLRGTTGKEHMYRYTDATWQCAAARCRKLLQIQPNQA